MNVKPGDRAVVIFVGKAFYQTNVGRVVRVLCAAEPMEYKRYGTLARWWIRSEGTVMQSSYGKQMEGKMPDIALRPLLDIDETETVDQREEITA